MPQSSQGQKAATAHDDKTTIAALANTTAIAALEGDGVRLRAATAVLCTALATATNGLDDADAEQLLTKLRDRRAHEAVVDIAERLLTRGKTSTKACHLYAQSLIDLGRVNIAIDFLHRMLDRISTGDKQYAEVMGRLGRAYKQLLINDQRHPRPASAVEALRRSLTFYKAALNDKPIADDDWNGINIIALQALADREGIELPGRFCDVAADARAMIAGIDPTTQDPWQNATLGEAHVALADWSRAAHFYGRFLAAPTTTPFHINSALRQLREIWQIRPSGEPAGQLLLALEARLASTTGGVLAVKPGDIQAGRAALNGGALPIFDQALDASTIVEDGMHVLPQTVYGDHKARPRAWFELLLRRSSSVARVKVGSETCGTGFLVRGGDLAPALGDELFLLTNAHVVSAGAAEENIELIGLTNLNVAPAMANEVRIVFDAGGVDQPADGYRCTVLWESPVAECDAALLRFTQQPVGIEACPIASQLPRLKVPGAANTPRPSRVFVIGHPGGGDLSISIEDCDLVATGSKAQLGQDHAHIGFLHYRSPTEAGNSGSPVFDERGWHAVGLHHFGSAGGTGSILSLDGLRLHRANEGVSLLSIAEAIKKEFPG